MFKPSKDYKLVDNGKIIAEGSAKSMRKLRNVYKLRLGEKYVIGNIEIYLSPTSKIGENIN